MNDTIITPISPKELKRRSGANIPDFVIKAINNLLTLNFARSGIINLLQEDIICEIIKEFRNTYSGDITREEIYTKKYLSFEELFGRYGWIVTYDKPGYNETYPSTFTFKAK